MAEISAKCAEALIICARETIAEEQAIICDNELILEQKKRT